MSKKASQKTTSFKYQPKHELPPLGKIHTTWNLKGHFYKSELDPRIERDAKIFEKAVYKLAKKYKNSNFTTSPAKLLKVLKDNDVLAEMPEATRILFYYSYRTELNINDTEATKKITQYHQRLKVLSNELLFIPLSIGKIPKIKQSKYLNDPKLQKYRYYLKSTFEEAKHHLSESEEKILSLRSLTSRGMWVDATEKIIGNRKVEYKGKIYAIPEALEQIDMLSWTEKSVLWEKIVDQTVNISEFVEHELSAMVTHDKISDELRGYKKPYSSTVQSYENNEKSVEALVDAISTKGFELSKKFYKLKANLHGKKTIPYINKYDPIADLPKPTFKQSVEVCRDTFYSIDTAYGSIFDRMLTEGHIDVYPKTGKRGGAFMRGATGVPTYVMLNHTNNFKSLETMAHEVGHAIHAELSKSQPAIYEDFSITTAETASTLFEQFVSDALLRQLDEKQKVVFLHDKISRDIATVQRQIACFNFELDMYNHIREHGLATKEELAKKMKKHLQSYLGPAVEVTDKEGYFYVIWPHLRNGFYVYSYSYGHLVSNSMIQKYRKDPNYLNNINKFLHAGGSDTVENIFAGIGINTNKVETFTESLKTQEDEIKLLEKLTRKK